MEKKYTIHWATKAKLRRAFEANAKIKTNFKNEF